MEPKKTRIYIKKQWNGKKEEFVISGNSVVWLLKNDFGTPKFKEELINTAPNLIGSGGEVIIKFNREHEITANIKLSLGFDLKEFAHLRETLDISPQERRVFYETFANFGVCIPSEPSYKFSQIMFIYPERRSPIRFSELLSDFNAISPRKFSNFDLPLLQAKADHEFSERAAKTLVFWEVLKTVHADEASHEIGKSLMRGSLICPEDLFNALRHFEIMSSRSLYFLDKREGETFGYEVQEVNNSWVLKQVSSFQPRGLLFFSGPNL